MKRSPVFLTLFIFLTAVCASLSFSQEVDLSGTWVGSTLIPDHGKDEVTLVLKEEGGELVATMSDSLGMLSEIECEDVEFENNTLTFNFTLTQDLETQTIWITLDLENETLKGYWEDEEGAQGDIELTKQGDVPFGDTLYHLLFL